MSNSSEENTRTLIDLGLTGAQAKIYLALLYTGPAAIKEIAQTSKVARPDTYRAVTQLQELGIVEKIVSVPTKFNSLPIKDAADILMLRKTKENIDLNKRTNTLIERLKAKTNREPHFEDDKLVLIPKEAIDFELRKLFSNAQESVYVMVSSKRMFRWVTKNYENIKEALKRKVTIRIITEDVSKSNTSREIDNLKKIPHFEIRHLVGPPTAWFRIYDRKEVVLTTATKPEETLHSAVWSNNQTLVELAQEYFDAAWFSAIEPPDQAFKKDSRQFDYLFANMTNGFAYCQMIFDKDGKPADFIYLQINDAFRKITRLKKEGVVGKRVTELIPGIKDANPEVFEIYGRVSLNGKGEKFEVFLTPLSLWLSISVYSPERGYFAAVFEDISERKKTEQKLSENELKYRNIFNNSEAGMFRTRLDGSEILDCNAKFLTIFGRARNEVIGKSSIMLWAVPSERQEMVRLLQAKGHVADFECRMVNKQGDVKTCLTSLKLYPEQGILEGSIIDISERKCTEDALKKSQHFVQKILETTPTLIYIYDLMEHRNIYANREIVDLLGYTTEQINSMGSKLFSQILHPDDAVRVARHHAKLSKATESERFELEYRMKHSDGGWRWLHSIDIPFSFNQDGTVKQILGSAEDITEHKKVENTLLEKRRLNQIALDAIPCVALLLRSGTREIVASNKAAVRVGAVPGSKCFSTWGKRETPCPWCLAPSMWESGKEQHLEVESLGVVWDAYWVPVGKDLYMHYAFDISERKKIEKHSNSR